MAMEPAEPPTCRASRAHACAWLLVMSFLVPATVAAQAPLWETDPAAAGSRADSLLAAAVASHGVPGAVVALVRETTVLYLGGSGLADVGRGVPADPERTLFHLASISKVVAATAMLRLVEEGVLELDRDVNDYLARVRVPATFPEPITLRHLLTHTAGFDDRYMGKSAREPDDAAGFEAFVRDFMPRRVAPPGVVSTYSNFGIALAGLVAQDAAGEDFAELVRSRVFLPLGMTTATFRPDDVDRGRRTRRYIPTRARARELDDIWIRDYPAGQAVATAAEFARFMIAHLNDGRVGDARVLSPENARSMRQVQFTHHPALTGGWGWAFNLSEHDGRPLVAHDGGFPGMRARMWLLPGERVGIFIAANLMDEGFLWEVTNGVMDALVGPAAGRDAAPFAGEPAAGDVARFAGSYRLTRYARSTFEKAAVLTGAFPPELRIRATAAGALVMPDHLGQPRRLVQAEPLLFRSIDDDYALAFAADATGRVTHVFTNGATALERVAWWERVTTGRVVFLTAQPVFLVLAVVMGRRWLRARRMPADPGPADSLPALTGAVAFLFVAHILALAVVLGVLTPAEELLSGFGLGPPRGLFVAQALGVVAMAGTVALVVALVAALARRVRPARVAAYGAWTALFVTYLLFLDYWNLLGWRF